MTELWPTATAALRPVEAAALQRAAVGLALRLRRAARVAPSGRLVNRGSTIDGAPSSLQLCMLLWILYYLLEWYFHLKGTQPEVIRAI